MKPRDIIAPEEVVTAVTLIKQYCRNGSERNICDGCVLSVTNTFGRVCGLIDFPDMWDLTKFRKNVEGAET